MPDLTLPFIAEPPDLSTMTGQLHGLSLRAADHATSARVVADGDRQDTAEVDAVSAGQAASRASDGSVLAATAVTDSAAAFSLWRSTTPAIETVEAAESAAAEARQSLASLPAGAPDALVDRARQRVTSAEAALAELREQRETAARVLADALRRIEGRLKRRGKPDVEGGRPRVPGAPPRGPINVPGPPTPIAPPRTAPPATPPPSTSISSGTTPSADTLAQLLSGAAKPQPVQPPMMPTMPTQAMPTMPPVPQQPAAAPAPAGARDRKRGTADDLIDDLLGDDEDRTTAPGLAAAATVPAPRPAPAGSIAPAAPAVPATAGFSADGLRTDGPTSGRPGAAPAGAFAAPATSLSGTAATQQTMAGTGTTATTPATHPAAAPMTGPMGMPNGGGSGGGSGSARPPVLKHQGLDHGQSEMGQAVPGGTIARKPRD